MKKRMKTTLLLFLTLCLLVSAFTLPASAKDNAEVVKTVLRSQILFEDLTKLVETVKIGDGAKIFMCVLENYPDIVREIKKAITDDQPSADDGGMKEASVISVGDIVLLFVLTVVCSAGLGVAVTYGIMRKKRKKTERQA